MNILILGDSSSTFVKSFCTHVLTEEDCVCIFSYTNQDKFSNFYAELGIKEIHITPYIENCPIHWFNIISLLYKKTKEIKKLLSFNSSIDVIHVHYVEPSLLIYLLVFWITSRKRILTFWGSDLLRASEDNRKLQIPFLHMATSLNFMIPKQYQFFCDIYGNRFKKKSHIIDFGNELLDVIDDLRSEHSKAECKREFGLAVDKVTIHVGYNKDEAQQHIKILDKICLLPKPIIEKVQVVLPWGYGGGSASEENVYIREIRDLLDANGMDYTFVTDFLTGEKLAKFRMSCDILAYAQTTDAMSDSIIEYVYSGSIFLCPEWLWDNYSLINYNTKQCIKYSYFDDLSKLLCKILTNEECTFSSQIESEIQKTIYRNKSWKNLSVKWRKCYE